MAHQKVVQDFVKVLLQWDYEDLFSKYSNGEGVVDDLGNVPKKFKDLKERFSCIASSPLDCIASCATVTANCSAGVPHRLREDDHGRNHGAAYARI